MKEIMSDHLIISDLQFVFRTLFSISEMNINSVNASLYKLALSVTQCFTFLCRSCLLSLSQQSPLSGLETVNYSQGRRCVQHFLIVACQEARNNTEQCQKKDDLSQKGEDVMPVMLNGVKGKKQADAFFFRPQKFREKNNRQGKRLWMEEKDWKFGSQVTQLSRNMQKTNSGMS